MRKKKSFRPEFFFAVFVVYFACQAAPDPPSLNILISNDDGIEAPGIAALFESLLDLGDVTVATSFKNRSGTSHGVTSRDPIRVERSERKGMAWFGIDALPATCVRLAIEALLGERPDVVVSGINSGENIGTVTFYSATVACAREAAFLGIPAMAINLQRGRDMDYEAAAGFIKELIPKVLADGLPKGTYLNVNFPAVPRSEIKGIRMTRQDSRAPLEFFKKTVSPEGEVIYLPSYKVLEPDEEDTDIWAVQNGYIAITPLTIDQTDEENFSRLKSLEGIAWK